MRPTRRTPRSSICASRAPNVPLRAAETITPAGRGCDLKATAWELSLRRPSWAAGPPAPSPPLFPDPLDLPFELDAGFLLDASSHRLAQGLDVGGAGAAEIDQEIAVHLRDLRATDLEPAAAGGIDELPGLAAGRVLEGRAAGAALDRLGRLARFGDLFHLGGDRAGIAGDALEQGRGEDDVLGGAAMAIAVMHVAVAEHAQAALPVDAARLDEGVLGLAAIGAAVHAQRPADAAAGRDLHLAEAAAKPHHDARHAAVAHDQVRAEPDHGHGDLGRQSAQEIREVGLVLGHEQHLRRAADPEPGELGERLVRHEPAAQLRGARV